MSVSKAPAFRFGPPLAAVANLVLFAKEHSPQVADFIPYRVRGGAAPEKAAPAHAFNFSGGPIAAVDHLLAGRCRLTLG